MRLVANNYGRRVPCPGWRSGRGSPRQAPSALACMQAKPLIAGTSSPMLMEPNSLSTSWAFHQHELPVSIRDDMAQRLIELSCQRFRQSISPQGDRSIRSTSSLDEVRHAVIQIQTQLAARSSLRNLGRLSPYLDAIERYSKAIDPLCNGVPFLPYVWVRHPIHDSTLIMAYLLL